MLFHQAECGPSGCDHIHWLQPSSPDVCMGGAEPIGSANKRGPILDFFVRSPFALHRTDKVGSSVAVSATTGSKIINCGSSRILNSKDP